MDREHDEIIENVWITKWCLSVGILFFKSAKICLSSCPDGSMIEVQKVDGASSYTRYFHGKGRDWHVTYESALDRAEIMRKKKIAALYKQQEKLKSLKFQDNSTINIKI